MQLVILHGANSFTIKPSENKNMFDCKVNFGAIGFELKDVGASMSVTRQNSVFDVSGTVNGTIVMSGGVNLNAALLFNYGEGTDLKLLANIKRRSLFELGDADTSLLTLKDVVTKFVGKYAADNLEDTSLIPEDLRSFSTVGMDGINMVVHLTQPRSMSLEAQLSNFLPVDQELFNINMKCEISQKSNGRYGFGVGLKIAPNPDNVLTVPPTFAFGDLMPEFCDKDDEQNVLNNIELQRSAIVMSNVPFRFEQTRVRSKNGGVGMNLRLNLKDTRPTKLQEFLTGKKTWEVFKNSMLQVDGVSNGKIQDGNEGGESIIIKGDSVLADIVQPFEKNQVGKLYQGEGGFLSTYDGNLTLYQRTYELNGFQWKQFTNAAVKAIVSELDEDKIKEQAEKNAVAQAIAADPTVDAEADIEAINENADSVKSTVVQVKKEKAGFLSVLNKWVPELEYLNLNGAINMRKKELRLEVGLPRKFSTFKLTDAKDKTQLLLKDPRFFITNVLLPVPRPAVGLKGKFVSQIKNNHDGKIDEVTYVGKLKFSPVAFSIEASRIDKNGIVPFGMKGFKIHRFDFAFGATYVGVPTEIGVGLEMTMYHPNTGQKINTGGDNKLVGKIKADLTGESLFDVRKYIKSLKKAIYIVNSLSLTFFIHYDLQTSRKQICLQSLHVFLA